ncbi:hypothetical protein HJFPF1_03111 [Paramyrothecium foliicola]|nr:hypothetical protein HJFPF1_03111 [Paramyrothecium foliicola]
MGFLDALAGTENLSVISGGGHHRRHRSRSRTRHHHKKHRSRSRSRSSSRNRGTGLSQIFGFGDSHNSHHHHKHNSSRASFFGLGGNGSRSSFFGTNRSSYYKRQPRAGFMQRTWKQLKKIIRNLVHYAKRHPWKVFFLVIMPLITGGALTALLARFGLRMPSSLDRMIGMASRAASGDHLGLVNDAVRMAGDFGGSSSSSGSGNLFGGLGGVAKMFS